MIALGYYLLKVIVCSGILFLYYHIALRNKKFHQWNRFYLLALVILSLVVPLLQFTLFHYREEPTQAIQLLQVIESADSFVEEVYIDGRQPITLDQWLVFGYAVISALVLATVILSFIKIYAIAKRNKIQLVDRIRFISTKENGTPFSFFHYIFWNDEIDIHSTTGRQIFEHELVHVKEAHTYDKLFLQFTLVAFWCNPFFWLIRKELHLIHEFIADKKSVRHHDTAAFASMILHVAYPQQFSVITNQFFQSSIKRRITMLTKTKKNRFADLSRVAALLLIAFTVFAFTVRLKSTKPIISINKEMTVVIDAAHGKMANGQMNGARDGNIYEDNVVLALSKKIKELNTNNKINIILTRPSEAIVDLHKRVDIAKENKADLFISIHIGANVESADHSGMEVYVSNKNTPYQKESELLGSAVKEELSKIYITNPGLMKRSAGIWVLDKNICPAVLIECGYVTNPKDREFISREENQKIIAAKILTAIERYASSQN